MQIQISIPKSPIQIIQYETNMIIILQANNYTISQICMFNKHDYENKSENKHINNGSPVPAFKQKF